MQSEVASAKPDLSVPRMKGDALPTPPLPTPTLPTPRQPVDDAEMKKQAMEKAKALQGKVSFGKLGKLLEKLDQFKKPLPQDIPKSDKFFSCSGALLTLILYGCLACVAYWLYQVKQQLDLESMAPELPGQLDLPEGEVGQQLPDD